MFKIKQASRKNVKLKIGMFGPSGSGKTYSALKFAKGLVGDWSKIAMLDTENGSGELYSHLGKYLHCPMGAPFSPQRYAEAIEFINKETNIDCLVIDSISHEWEGVGGCLDIHSKMGGKFQDWAKITPLHNKFIQAILQAPFHVITTGRSKIDYAIDKDKNNRTTIKKVGLKTVTREGFDYEMTLAFQISIDHLALADKDRTDLFNTDSIPFMIDESTGELVKKWNDEGVVDYLKEFKDVGRKILGSDKHKWEYAKSILEYDNEEPNGEYWKEMTEKLKFIDIALMESAVNS